MGDPALYWNNVSPLVSDITIIPNCPLRILPAKTFMSARRDSTPRGDVYAGGGGAAGFFATFLRVVLFLTGAFFLVEEDVVFFFVWASTEWTGAAAMAIASMKEAVLSRETGIIYV